MIKESLGNNYLLNIPKTTFSGVPSCMLERYFKSLIFILSEILPKLQIKILMTNPGYIGSIP